MSAFYDSDTRMINMTILCGELSAALSNECSPITSDEVLARFASCASEFSGMKVYKNEQGEYLISTISMYGIYADWISGLGAALGFDIPEDVGADDWITDSMPETRALKRQLIKIAVKGISSLDDDLKSKVGYSATEVFWASLNSGESLTQSQTRLHTAHNGLKAVKK